LSTRRWREPSFQLEVLNLLASTCFYENLSGLRYDSDESINDAQKQASGLLLDELV